MSKRPFRVKGFFYELESIRLALRYKKQLSGSLPILAKQILIKTEFSIFNVLFTFPSCYNGSNKKKGDGAMSDRSLSGAMEISLFSQAGTDTEAIGAAEYLGDQQEKEW